MPQNMWANRLGDVGAVGDFFDDLLGAAWGVAYLVVNGEEGFEHGTDAVAHGDDTALALCAIWPAFSKDDELATLPINIVPR